MFGPPPSVRLCDHEREADETLCFLWIFVSGCLLIGENNKSLFCKRFVPASIVVIVCERPNEKRATGPIPQAHSTGPGRGGTKEFRPKCNPHRFTRFGTQTKSRSSRDVIHELDYIQTLKREK